MTRRIGGLTAIVALMLMGADAGGDMMFMSLFDGKTLSGWVPDHTDRFSVRNEVIFGDGGIGWLRSAKAYKNFEFQVEYRALQKGADSGIFFRSSLEGSTQEPFWPARCYHLQVADADNNLMIFGLGTPPPTFDRKAEVLKEVMKGPGEWQKIVLKVTSKRAEVSLNGKLVTVTDAINLAEGYLGLQGENGQFEWRELKIKELPAMP